MSDITDSRMFWLLLCVASLLIGITAATYGALGTC